MVDYSDLVSEHTLSSELSVSVWTLRSWRRKDYGPPAIKLGKRVLYRRTDVRAFLADLR